MLLPWSGLAVMRTGWEKADAWAMLDAGPFGRGHQHEDKLNLLFYAAGKMLLTEGGNYAYDASPMRSYVLDTASHNTVRVDGLPQNRKVNYTWQEDMIRHKAPGIQWHHGEAWDYAEGVYDEGYGPEAKTQAVHRRRVFFRRTGAPLVLVVDRLEAAEPHVYEWLWHVDSAVVAQEPGSVRMADMDVVYAHGTAEVVTGQEQPEWQGFVATGTKQGMYRAVPCVCVRAEGVCLRQVTVMAVHDGETRLTRVLADPDGASGLIRLIWSDGREEALEESVLMTL